MPDPKFTPRTSDSLDGAAIPATAEDLAEIQRLLALKPLPVPVEALALLRDTAAGDTGGSVAARSFLFWLIGEPDPTGLGQDGALELRRLDPRHKEAALAVLAWWTGPTQSDMPVYDVLEALSRRFKVENDVLG